VIGAKRKDASSVFYEKETKENERKTKIKAERRDERKGEEKKRRREGEREKRYQRQFIRD